MMPPFRHLPLVATFSFLALSGIAAKAVGEEFRCQRGDLVRRIELRFANDADRLPCEVISWLDSEAPGQSQTLWNAQHQLDFCRNKARETVERLESAGWACNATASPSTGTAQTATGGSPEPPPPEPEDLEKTAPSPPQSPSTAAAQTATGRSPEQSEPEPGNIEKTVPSPPEDATGRPDQATLRAALARDIRRLDQLTADSAGEFDADMATLGDLNGDGLEDAAVLLTHRADGSKPTHYLLAYLFDGHTFRPVARMNLEAFYKNFADVGIQEVADGAVELLLHIARDDDPQCCPSGRRRATFALRDREFVLLKESDSGT